MASASECDTLRTKRTSRNARKHESWTDTLSKQKTKNNDNTAEEKEEKGVVSKGKLPSQFDYRMHAERCSRHMHPPAPHRPVSIRPHHTLSRIWL